MSPSAAPSRVVAMGAARRQFPGAAIAQGQAALKQPDERFFGPQVPSENFIHWIAERAPPVTS
jgi:hypothetical protein